jgi:hypothetical protein
MGSWNVSRKNTMPKKPKSDYAIIVSCNPGYGFGMISSMNAQNDVGTNADWEIAYEDYSDEEREKISNAFPFHVNWTPISKLMAGVEDKRSDKREPLNRFWLAYWLMALKVLKEGKYKAVCVIQADVFVFVNLDGYFSAAASGVLACSEYPFSFLNADCLPFGDDRAIWDRGQCGIFDAVNFIGPQYVEMINDIINFQAEDPFKGEASHSVIALNRSVCKHGKKEKMLRLDRNTWVCDSMWGETRLSINGDWTKVYNDRMIQINAWHSRFWQDGRASVELRCCEEPVKRKILVHNFNLIRDFMVKFNARVPEISSPIYTKEVFQ